jgi:hypothetical protein
MDLEASTLISTAALQQRILKMKAVERMVGWLDAMPRPPIAIEIAWDRIAAVRLSRKGTVEAFAVEPLQPGSIVPSAVETNVMDSADARSTLARVCSRLDISDEDTALLLPDPVVRVFMQRFGEFPKSHKEALPFLRWKLKKSVPFDIEDTTISYVRRPTQENGVDVIVVVARLRVVREYEELVESVGLNAGVVLSSSLAALDLFEDRRLTLLARIADSVLTTAVLRDGVLCGYRCTELPVRGSELTPKLLLEEMYPLAAYYQDTLDAPFESVCLSGIGTRFPEFAGPIEGEFHCNVQPLLRTSPSDGRIGKDALPLAESGMEALLGWLSSRE